MVIPAQMTMFTAEGILRAEHRLRDRGVCGEIGVITNAYLRWLFTQGIKSKEAICGGRGR